MRRPSEAVRSERSGGNRWPGPAHLSLSLALLMLSLPVDTNDFIIHGANRRQRQSCADHRTSGSQTAT